MFTASYFIATLIYATCFVFFISHDMMFKTENDNYYRYLCSMNFSFFFFGEIVTIYPLSYLTVDVPG